MAKTIIKLPTIKELRAEGWKVRSSHFRYFGGLDSELTPIKDMRREQNGPYMIAPEPNGGKIVLELRDPQGHEYKGESVCSRNDSFNKRAGRTLALVRALKPKVPEPEFKVGDLVWTINGEMKAVQAPLDFIRDYAPTINTNTGTLYFDQDFGFLAGVFEVDASVEHVFATKKELLEFIAS